MGRGRGSGSGEAVEAGGGLLLPSPFLCFLSLEHGRWVGGGWAGAGFFPTGWTWLHGRAGQEWGGRQRDHLSLPLLPLAGGLPSLT